MMAQVRVPKALQATGRHSLALGYGTEAGLGLSAEEELLAEAGGFPPLGADGEGPAEDAGPPAAPVAFVDVLPDVAEAHDRFDMAANGTFPPRPPDPMFEVLFQKGDAGVDRDAEPFGWVPGKAEEGKYIRPTTAQYPVKNSTTVALELFDNPEIDVKTPEEWLADADPSLPGVTARSRYYLPDGHFTWAPCYVVRYSRQEERYTIQWVSNGTQKKVKRLNLIFDSEDEQAFKQRLNIARQFCSLIEKELKYLEYIDQADFEITDILDEDFRNHVIQLADYGLALKHEDVVHDYVESLRSEYFRSVKESIILLQAADPNHRKRLAIDSIFLPLQTRYVPERGCAPRGTAGGEIATTSSEAEGIESEAYPSVEHSLLQHGMNKILCTANPKVVDGLQFFFKNMDIRGKYMIISDLEQIVPPVTLGTFRDAQDKQLTEVCDFFHNEWGVMTYGMLEDLPAAQDESVTGKLQFQRIVKMISLIMADQLRTVVLQSVEAFTELFGNYDLEKERDTGHSPRPFFEIRLEVIDGKVVFEPSLSLLETTVLETFDAMCERVLGIEDITSKTSTAVSNDTQDMATVSPDEAPVKAAREYVKRVLTQGMGELEDLEKSYAEFSSLASMDIDEVIPKWVKGGHSLETSEAEIQKYLDLHNTIKDRSENSCQFTMIVVNVTGAKKTLMSKALQVRGLLMDHIAEEWNKSNIDVCEKYEEVRSQMKTDPNNAEELDELYKFFEKSREELEELEACIEESGQVFEALHRIAYPMKDEDSTKYWETSYWPMKLVDVISEGEMNMARKRARFQEDLKNDVQKLMDEIDTIDSEVETFITYGEIEQVEERLAYVTDIEQKLKEAQELAEVYQSREAIFEMPETEYPNLAKIAKTFTPYGTLWKGCAEFMRALPDWTDGPFTELDTDQITADTDRWYLGLVKSMKQLAGKPLDVAAEMQEKLKAFQEHLPLIVALRNPGLRDRHWDKMGKAIGFAVKADESFSLNRALQLELPKHIQAIEEVSEYASKEYSLERTLDKMQGEWIGVAFEYIDWRETGTQILKGIDDIQMILDDQIVKTQSMRASPYIGPFEDRVRIWEKKLNTVQEIIDEWLKCQQQWLYLEPIFGSDDIMQQMPNEGRKFKAVDATWRRTMEKCLKNPEVLVVCSDEELQKNLVEANKLLDLVQKGLNDYLETKRLAFPRFYFLSNDELLEILSETKDPLRVQPFLKKIFEGINKIKFEDDLEVTAMISEEGENVPFKTTFNPKNAGGNVEKWLIECEDSMRESIADVTKKSFEDYTNSVREDWVVKWPGQAVICVDSMYWTSEVAEAIGKGELKEYADLCTENLLKIVGKVRGKLSKLERKTLSALIVIDVHARDVILDLHKQGVAAESDFSWMSQLRYEWDDSNGEVIVRMINASIYYGYEYLGNSSRLVITPLTDRCYRTLMGALHLNLGGAPEGPAGTGKTETTKDLAKAIAMQCVVFNCSDGLDYLAMGKFFKGLASSGAWACFDEFNRIDLEVLSVIAHQILTIQRAKAAKVTMFEFEGTKLGLRDTCSVFITMNPGYAGRSELPDNLKALFRTVAMMVPDYALIAEILLYSSGYLKARDLARKLVATYRLCSEQLSSQSHYDYGMRAVISVLRAAGAMKQKFPDQEEDILMLRSLKDVNLPKFLAPDIPLFKGILSDLFPGVKLPEADYDILRKRIQDNCAKANVQPVPTFMAKTFELYEMILVRHGLMIVGFSYGAKTSMYRALAGALSDCCENGELDENKTRIRIMNPKSIYIGQLYGQFDPVSHEWQDGVLAKVFRECAVDTTPDRKWVMFDGPVDAIWIENMNTVLDDNKKLCLMSGEIIQMSSTMNMIFEVQDLAVASPATVSRCGMVYVEPSQIGWRPLKDSWMNTLPGHLEGKKDLINSLFEWLVDPCLRFVRKNCKEIVPTADINLPQSLMNMMWSYFDEFHAESCKVKKADIDTWLYCIFAFSAVWSLGGSIDADGRDNFSAFFVKLLAQQVDASAERKDFDLGPGLEIKYPEAKFPMAFPKGSVYDFCFDKKKQTWVGWMDTVKVEQISTEKTFNEIVVTTVDTVRYSALLESLVTHGKHVIFAGPTGTGKTVYIKEKLDALDTTKFNNIQTAFSAQTNANQTQDIIDNKLDKRRKGVYGPPFGMKCIIFVDDLNMPALETYGAQPPIELLRQWMDHEGWYDRSDNTMRNIVDVQFIASMGPPGGGRNDVTPRFVRHFNMIAINEFTDQTYARIYETILDWWMRRSKISPDLKGRASAIVKATIQVYNTIREELLPTPAKSHYTYNMRDLSKVFQGMQMFGGTLDGATALARLWCHETLRVFHDRLVSDADREWFFTYTQTMVNTTLGMDFNDVFSAYDLNNNGVVDILELRRLMYGDFLVPGAENPKYVEVTDQKKLLETVEEYLRDYNANPKNQMHLVLFLYAAEHICRISRVIKQPYGNGLLVGVGGSGRQSLTKISTFMAEYSLFSIEISKSYGVTEWREDLRTVLRKSGGENQQTVFLFNDTQIKYESFLEDLNNILNTGEVPNLFPKDELMNIMELVRPRAKKVGRDKSPTELYDFFIEQCRKNLHTVICMSPVGDAFRTRLRMFPSLVNCCTIDWFAEWPQDALKSVAQQFLAEVEMKDQKIRNDVEDMCMIMHQDVRTLADEFYADLKRHYYATPTSYLELISMYKTLLADKRKEVMTMKTRYEVGLEKLLGAEKSVGEMKEELIALQPVLIQTSKEVEETLVVVNKESAEAAEKAEVVAGEEAIANEAAAKAKEIKDDCESELAVAIPMLESAIAALNTLTKSDITEVKALKNPPAVVKLVMEAVCHMLSMKPKRINDPNDPVRKIDDYWGPSQTLLADGKFLDNLKAYDKDNIDPKIVTKIKPYIENPDFEPAVVKKASKACYGLCCWVRAMEAYDRVAKVVAPKKAALAIAETEFAELMKTLNAKKAELKEVQDKVAALQAKLDELLAKKKQLEIDVDNCKKKLDRAEKLIGGLGGEKTRWTAVAKQLNSDYTNLTGDVLLSSGFIAYLGAFTAKYREKASTKWVTTCQTQEIPCSDKFSLQAVLGQPVTIRDWVIDGLPNDEFSIKNAISMSQARRWPLLIDPQGQANKWIRNMEKKHTLEVVKLTDSDFIRKLESSIQFGFPVMLENIGEELDPTLEPLLLKSLFKVGGALSIKLGDSTIEYSEQFRFYMVTKLRNPHYLPEIAVKVTLLNFMITPDGLSDQLLGIVVMRERPELEEEKTKLVLQGAENARQLKEIEDKIIEVLSSSEGNILEDETAINVISSSKVLSNEIDAKQKIAAQTEQKIDDARMGYTPVAIHTSLLFFNISDLANIEPTYQYSLPWFVDLFERSIRDADKSEELQVRIDALIDHFTYSLYRNVCRSLFGKDRLLFAFTLCITIVGKVHKKLSLEEYGFLLTGGVATSSPPPNPSTWLVDKNWGEMNILSKMPGFEGLAQHFADNDGAWKAIYDSTEPQEETLPEPWVERLTQYQQLMVMRCIRPDKLVGAVQNYVRDEMGQRYIEPPPFDLEACYNDSSCISPLIFVLSPGSDPMAALMSFADKKGVTWNAISLGQGQGPKAEKLISEGQQSGNWVVLQNCHLAVSWMTTLERICEQITTENTNPAFRLWLTSYPSQHFPVSVLQNGVKMTNEAPKGLRANLLQTYMQDPLSDPEFFNGCEKPREFKKLLFGLCFFHAFVQERLKFGPLGWNVPYQFSIPDFAISVQQLQMFLNEFQDGVPLDALGYLVGECNYGGRVTDAHDRVTIMSILDIFFIDDILEDGYTFSTSGIYYAPEDGPHEAYTEYIKQLPLNAAPEAFGLHANADITKERQETDLMLDSMLSTVGSSSSSGGGQSREDILSELATSISEKVPQAFDLEFVNYKYPVDYYESMNTVLCQELVRFNRLIVVVHSTLASFKKALKGLVVMSGDLEKLGVSMFEGKIPALWAGKSYPSMKPLGRYVDELCDRLKMMQDWIDNGPPPVFWISGFYFTHAFTTGVMQNYARKHKFPIDTITFDFECLPQEGDYGTKPEDGAYIDGMYVEGARWDHQYGVLAESKPKVLYSEAPKMWLQPCRGQDIKTFSHYLCPVYRTPERRGTLATTGHSTNFVIDLRIPSDKPQSHWIRRGVAFLLSLAQ